MSSTATRDVVVSLIDGDTVLSSWLIGVPADAATQDFMPDVLQELLPLAMAKGVLSPTDGGAVFGVRDADPEEDADLYAAELREKGLLN